MMWVALVLLGLFAIPLTIELTRAGMTDAVRAKAPANSRFCRRAPPIINGWDLNVARLRYVFMV